MQIEWIYLPTTRIYAVPLHAFTSKPAPLPARCDLSHSALTCEKFSETSSWETMAALWRQARPVVSKMMWTPARGFVASVGTNLVTITRCEVAEGKDMGRGRQFPVLDHSIVWYLWGKESHHIRIARCFHWGMFYSACAKLFDKCWQIQGEGSGFHCLCCCWWSICNEWVGREAASERSCKFLIYRSLFLLIVKYKSWDRFHKRVWWKPGYENEYGESHLDSHKSIQAEESSLIAINRARRIGAIRSRESEQVSDCWFQWAEKGIARGYKWEGSWRTRKWNSTPCTGCMLVDRWGACSLKSRGCGAAWEIR